MSADFEDFWNAARLLEDFMFLILKSLPLRALDARGDSNGFYKNLENPLSDGRKKKENPRSARFFGRFEQVLKIPRHRQFIRKSHSK